MPRLLQGAMRSCINVSPRLSDTGSGGSGVLARAQELGSLLVRVVTWNLQARATAGAAALREELLPPLQHHIYVVGTEECENSIAKSVIIQSKKNWDALLKETLGPQYAVLGHALQASHNANPNPNPPSPLPPPAPPPLQSKKNWEALLKETLGPQYVMLCGHALQASHNVVFVHQAILPLISRVRSFAVATGLGTKTTKLGNKGGIGIAVEASIGSRVGQTKVLFVNAHFAAHQNHVEERIEHFHQIQQELLAAFGPACDDQPPPDCGPLRPLDSFDHVIWSGDLNFRINAPRPVCDLLLQKRMHEVLMANEQLSIARAEGKVFEGYQEGPLGFMPTYKYDKGCDVFDTSPKQLYEYDAVTDLRSSDHRPVFATFRLPFTTPPLSPLPDACGPPISLNQTTSEVCCVQ
ncbi:Endonuclease/exonuclease/phosphatase [Tribonema minus]|uniref:Endonuclease/exonuclease/phosphatase n=1 Tax=Tribonema minus TaxID=303371 RepID=A0A836C851_9STRA|nr:Endonuclease/exonuclease/phosphatase [Tribonema minus]